MGFLFRRFLSSKTTLAFCFSVLIIHSFSQSNTEDSLKSELSSANDSMKIVLWNRLALLNAGNSINSAINYGNSALGLAKKIKSIKGEIKSLSTIGDVYVSQNDYKKGIEIYNKAYEVATGASDTNLMANVLNSIAIAELYQEDYDQALKTLKDALYLSQRAKDTNQIIISLNTTAGAYYYKEDYESALGNYIKAAKVSGQKGDKTSEAQSRLNIGNIYLVLGNNKDAKQNYLDALKIFEQLKDNEEIANCQSNIGVVFTRLQDYTNALDYHQKALAIRESLGNKVAIALSYMNIGNIYKRQKDFKKSLNYYRKTQAIYEELSNQAGIASLLLNIGIVYSDMGEHSSAIANYTKAMEIIRGLGNKEMLSNCYEELSAAYSAMGDYKNAHLYMEQLSLLKDTLYNESKAEVLTEMQTKYDTENKEKSIALLTKDKELKDLDIAKQKILRNSFVGGLVLALVLAFLLYNRYKVKQRANLQLNQKNTELHDKNVLIEKQKESIVDSINYAQRIQSSILLEEKEIQKFLPQTFVYYQPKDIVSGDFYWFSKVDGKIIISAVDCTGHGVPGAFMSMIGNSLLNHIVNEKHIVTPSKILEQLHLGIRSALHQHKAGADSMDGMDITLCSIDFEQKTFEYAGAQNPLYMVSDGNIELIKADGYSIGGQLPQQEEGDDNRQFTNYTFPIKEGTTLYMFSDGYNDQFGGPGPQRKKFGRRRFQDMVLAIQSMDMAAQKEVIAKTMEEWKGHHEQIDDMMVVGVRF